MKCVFNRWLHSIARVVTEHNFRNGKDGAGAGVYGILSPSCGFMLRCEIVTGYIYSVGGSRALFKLRARGYEPHCFGRCSGI